MIRLEPKAASDGRLRVLCIGAHSDDIEIGCAGTLMRWLEEFQSIEVLWVVYSATGDRAREAQISAERLLGRAAGKQLVFGDFIDGRIQAEFERAKDFTAELSRRMNPDVVLTHRIEDRHQDHRIVGELTWQTWRDHLVLEYEIPKYEGDLGQPNVYVPISAAHREQKLRHLSEHFATQRSKGWFRDETFDAMMRLRAIECRAPSGYAEAFHARKLTL
jgi:LmbE family N-acetylglucosaminyl deacetylase